MVVGFETLNTVDITQHSVQADTVLNNSPEGCHHT
jgi:hypothetical protein